MTEKIRLAVIDDEPLVCQRLKQVFRRSGFEIETFGAGKPALERMAQQPFQLILTDICLPDIDGLEILKRIKKEYPGTEVILITGYATLDQAVEAVKKGAFYYLSKPFTPDQVRAVVKRAQEHIQISSENKKLREEVYQKIQYEGIVGHQPQNQGTVGGYQQGFSD